MREKLRLQSPKARQMKSEQIAAKLLKDKYFKKARSIVFYSSLEEEVQTGKLISECLAQGKQVLLPYVDGEDLRLTPILNPQTDLIEGSYGILEPKPSIRTAYDQEQLELVLVPGLAFDQANCRLGRGKAFYDRFLAKLPQEVYTYGLAYDFQMVDALPVTELDIPLTRVIKND